MGSPDKSLNPSSGLTSYWTQAWLRRLDEVSTPSTRPSTQASTPLQSHPGLDHLHRRFASLSSLSSATASDLQDGDPDVIANQLMIWGRQTQTQGLATTLPVELLILIFRHLPSGRDVFNAMLVSKTWCHAAFPMLWQRPALTSVDQFASFSRVISSSNSLLPYSNAVRRLYFNSFATDLSDDLFRCIAACKRLERVTLAGACHLSHTSLSYVFSQLPDLIAIDLSGVDAVDDNVVSQIATNCSQLLGLNLSDCKLVGDEGILAVAGNSKLLRRVKLARCHRITDRSVVALTRGCPLLQELDLEKVPQLSNDTVTALFMNTVHLRELRIKEHEYINDSAIPDLGRLATLNDTERIYEALGAYPWYLLGVPSPKAMSRTSTRPNIDIRLLRPVASTFDQLRQVDLTSCTMLGDQAVDNLITNAPRLRSLTLAKCTRLTDASIESVARLGKHLHYLHVGHVVEITDESVIKLAKRCTRLRYVEFASCTRLTDRSIMEVAANMPKLRRLGLVKLGNVTDNSIRALAERYATLERVHLSYCQRVTVQAIAYMLNHLQHLTHLSLTGINVFRTAELQQLSREPPAEFDPHQRASFRVYSGVGVANLRNYLNASLYESESSSTRPNSAYSTSSRTTPRDGTPLPREQSASGPMRPASTPPMQLTTDASGSGMVHVSDENHEGLLSAPNHTHGLFLNDNEEAGPSLGHTTGHWTNEQSLALMAHIGSQTTQGQDEANGDGASTPA